MGGAIPLMVTEVGPMDVDDDEYEGVAWDDSTAR